MELLPDKRQRLSNVQVEQIRELYSTTKVTQKMLSDMYGVSTTQINLIIHKKSRKDID